MLKIVKLKTSKITDPSSQPHWLLLGFILRRFTRLIQSTVLLCVSEMLEMKSKYHEHNKVNICLELQLLRGNVREEMNFIWMAQSYKSLQ